MLTRLGSILVLATMYCGCAHPRDHGQEQLFKAELSGVTIRNLDLGWRGTPRQVLEQLKSEANTALGADKLLQFEYDFPVIAPRPVQPNAVPTIGGNLMNVDLYDSLLIVAEYYDLVAKFEPERRIVSFSVRDKDVEMWARTLTHILHDETVWDFRDLDAETGIQQESGAHRLGAESTD